MPAAASDVLIVGAGLAGLACGVALADRGLAVTVLERDAQAGGRARSWVDAATGDTIDIGPHIVHSEYRNFPALLERLGTRSRIAWHRDKLITIVTRPRVTELRHRPLTPPLSLLPDLVRAPGLGLRDLLSNTPPTWRAMKFGEDQVPELDSSAAADFLRALGTTEPMIDWFYRFAAMAVMNVPLERCSMAALMRVHSQLIGHRGIHFGFPAIGLAELYAAQAVRAIESAGGRVLLRSHVAATSHSPERHAARLADGTELAGRQCVFAVPPKELAALQPALAPTDFEPSPYVSLYLWFDRKLTRERFWALPWSPTRMNYDFYDLSNIREGWDARPSVTASNIIYSHAAQELDDGALVEATVREIAQFLPEAAHAKVTHASVHRIPMAIVCPTPGSESKRPPARTRLAGVHLAGDWTRTHMPSSMESAVCSGFLAAEAVLADLGQRESIALETRPNDGLAGLVQRVARWRRCRAR
ncbi:MAG: FAD-dependent oxidoreductase [Betaproteobacteria bacterium]